MTAVIQGMGLMVAFLLYPIPPKPNDSARIDEILGRYEQAMFPFTSFDARFRRITYDDVFSVQKNSQGRIYFESSRQALLDQKPLQPPKGVTSKRLSKDGKPYAMTEGPRDKWIWRNGCAIKYACDGSQRSECIELPAPTGPSWELSSSRAKSSWWDFSFDLSTNCLPPITRGIPASELRRSFEITLKKNSILSFVPIRVADSAFFRSMDVLFDESGIPLAIKIESPTGQAQDIYVFEKESIRVNLPLQPGDDPLELKPNKFELLIRETLLNISPHNRLN